MIFTELVSDQIKNAVPTKEKESCGNQDTISPHIAGGIAAL
jgi:hypothetical protein